MRNTSPANSAMERPAPAAEGSSTGLSPADLADLLERMSDGFIAIDGDWRITSVNAAAEKTNGMSRDTMLGRDFWEVFPDVVGTTTERHLRLAMSERVPVRGESYYQPYDRWFEMEIQPVPSGSIAFYGRDITMRKRGEQSEERFRRYFELGLIGMALTSPSKGLMEVNDRFCDILGYTRDELLRMNWADMTHPEDLAADVAQFERVLSGEVDGYTLEKRWIRKDGHIIEGRISVNCVRRPDGSVDYFVALLEDVTERNHAEAALRRSEERYRSLIAQVREFAIFSTDNDGVVTSWNEGCQEVLGYTEQEFVGLDTAELYTPEDRAEGIPARELRMASEAGTVVIERWMMGSGSRRFFGRGARAALRDPSGRPIGFSTVIRDVTQMKATQDELVHHGQALERLVTERTNQLEKTTERLRMTERMASLGTLAAGLGHDMGNLLLPLDIRLDLLLQAELPPELHEHVVGIQKCARYLQRLSKGLRLLATDPSSARTREATELGRWWGDASLVLKDVLSPGLRLEHQLPREECWVGIGRTGLTQAVFNLVQNAVDAFKGRSSGQISIDVEIDPSTPWIALSVRDDGPGMSEEVLRRCMEPYFSTKARGESTGMGLAFVHGLVEGVGGSVEIDSVPGRGTTITLLLPRPLPEQSRTRLPGRPRPSGARQGASRR